MSLAFIGSAEDKSGDQARIFKALSITRLEGSPLVFAATRWVMEKVGFRGLMWSRDEEFQGENLRAMGGVCRLVTRFLKEWRQRAARFWDSE
jgi:hypothetical protein